jgi:hypothetical protein
MYWVADVPQPQGVVLVAGRNVTGDVDGEDIWTTSTITCATYVNKQQPLVPVATTIPSPPF